MTFMYVTYLRKVSGGIPVQYDTEGVILLRYVDMQRQSFLQRPGRGVLSSLSRIGPITSCTGGGRRVGYAQFISPTQGRRSEDHTL